MRLYIEAELPDFCYVSEAAFWVALGRVPPDEREIIEGENRDYIAINIRLGEDAQWNGEVTNFGLAFSASEFREIGVEVDHFRYVEGKHRTHGLPGDEYLAEARSHEEERERNFDFKSVNPDYEKVRAELRAEDLHAAKEADWALRHEEPFESIVDRARAIVFDALASGKIAAKGWLAYTDEEMQQYDGDGPAGGRGGRFIGIRPNQWTLRHFDWAKDTLQSGESEFSGAMVSVSDMLKLFPEPICGTREVKGAQTAGCLIVEGPGAIPAQSNLRRGRPPKGDGLAQTAVRNEFTARKAQDRLAEKREANIQSAIEWAEGILGLKVGRSTMQRWLKGVL